MHAPARPSWAGRPALLVPQARNSLKEAEGERDRLAVRLKALEGQLLDSQASREERRRPRPRLGLALLGGTTLRTGG